MKLWGSTLRRTFGRYELIAHVGRGGMAEIYLARQHGAAGFERLVALKLLRQDFIAIADYVTMFEDEARLSALLEHPNVVHVFDAGRVGSHHYLAMEYLLGENLEQLLRVARQRREPLPVRIAAQIAMRVADGLHYAHTRTGLDGEPLGVVHRDVSPQNIVVRYDGVVKVLDFGVAKSATRITETQTGALKGKVPYMSPEHVLGEDLDGQSDVFSLGAVLWECLTGRRLYREGSPWQIMERIVREDAPNPATIAPAVPATLAQLTLRALARERARRFATAAELSAALVDFLQSTGEPFDAGEVATLMGQLFGQRHAGKLSAFEQADTVNQTLPGHQVVDLSDYLSDYLTEPRADAAPSPELDRRTVEVDALRVLAPPFPYRAVVATLLLVILLSAAAWALLGGDGGTAEPPTVLAGAVSAADQQTSSSTATAAAEAASAPRSAGSKLDAGSAPDPGFAAPASLAEPVVDASSLDSAPAQRSANQADREGSRRAQRRAAVKPRSRGAKRRGSAPPVRTTSTRAPAAEQGKLRLVTRPWANIYFEGRKLGLSPLVDVALPVGVIRLRAVNEEAGIDQRFSVEIMPGPRATKHTIQLNPAR